jgi:hypothetical protein
MDFLDKMFFCWKKFLDVSLKLKKAGVNMKKKYLCVSQNAFVSKNNFVYFFENVLNILSFWVNKNDFVFKNKFLINFLIGAFILLSVLLKFLI